MKKSCNHIVGIRFVYNNLIKCKKICIIVIIICLGFIGCNKKKDISNIKSESITASSPTPTILGSQNWVSNKNPDSNEVGATEVIPSIEEVDYSDCFNGMEGCAVFFNSENNVYKMYNKDLCEKSVSPCSTFKIMATIMGLEIGVIKSVDSTMSYDGTVYPMDTWNEDLCLKDAFRESCVWYFRKVIDKIGESEVQRYLKQLNYGNCDIREWEGSGINPLPQLNGFWLESSLEITPNEQVSVISDIFDGKTNFSKKSIETLKEVMLVQKDENVSVYGKTGSGKNADTGNKDNGWFVGMFENSVERYYFAVHLNDESKEVSGPIAKEIALDIINEYYVEK